MGVSSYVFPTAEHSRFAHSLGVYATAKKFFKHLQDRALVHGFQTPVAFDEYSETDFCIAALCHDIGHTAFSHVLESDLLPEGVLSHEECSLKILDAADLEIGGAVRSVADIASVKSLLKKSHPNQALADLLSSGLDVDRCDYILRDSKMAGVEYGSFDLNWLLHAITVEANELGQPVLLMDGPRGMDALRQFLSARRYLYRQVYFHSTIRGAQILLKGIFARLQDLGPVPDTLRLAPEAFHPMTRGKKMSMEGFLETTDIEILYMLRSFARSHSDPVLKYLARCFTRRTFPKCILDSGKANLPIARRYRIATEPPDGQKVVPTGAPLAADFAEVAGELKRFVGKKLSENGVPEDAASYLVAFDSARFVSSSPTDLLFSFRGEVVALHQIDPECVGFDVAKLLETFSITRLFVPREVAAAALEYLDANYAK
jgi:HD superfamily phosphohydrolase